jgi:hypothetical protein
VASAAGTPTLTDSQGGSSNSYSSTTLQSVSGYNAQIFYCVSPAHVGATHKFILTGGVYAYLDVYFFANASAFHSSNGYANTPPGGGTFQPGAVTPSVNGSVILFIASNFYQSSTPTCASPTFTFTNFSVGGTSPGTFTGYLLQSTAASVNPTIYGFGWVPTAASILDFNP